MTMSMIAQNAESNAVSLPTSIDHSTRRATDKYWMVLFVIAIIIWSVAGPKVVLPNSLDNIYSDNSILANTTSECIQPKFENSTITKFTSLYVSNVLGKNWFLDVFMFNAGFLDTNYNRSDLIKIWAHILFCACLIIYIFTSMHSNGIYRQQFFRSIITLFVVSISTQEILMHQYMLDTHDTSDPVLHVLSWLIPEAILFIIGRTILLPTRNDDDSNGNDNNENDNREIVHLSTLLYAANVIIVILLCITFTIWIPVMFKNETEFQYKLIWSSEWSMNGIAIAAICYFVLVIYYFLLMIISCVTSIAYEKRDNCKLKNLHNCVCALPIVVRYHFGTVCYHATVIFPRIHATFVMNEKEFRENPKFSAIYRLYLTHWKIPNLSSTLTAACGYSYSESIRQSLRLFNSDSPKLNKFQTFSQTHKCCSMLLIMIQSLILISLWIHGVTINSDFTTVMWLAYLLAIGISFIITRFYDAVADVLWYLDDGTFIIKF